MNWLAHILLSKKSIDFQIGNFIADPYKARPWENASNDLKNGMHIHKIIDSYSDKHETFKRSKKRLKEKGLLKGIIIDFVYDYLLTKNWDKYCNIKLEDFTQEFYERAYIQKDSYPLRANQIVENMIARDLLNYSDFLHLKKAFQRLDMRLSPKLAQRDSAISYYEIVCEKIDKLEEDFLEFFPDLIKRVNDELIILDEEKLNHIKI
ncbi:ACP phosphodiesterase [Arcobacter sp. YIC-310]|uniref:acyl carrier protein phosphodiesterase n=1 Tax=Arcobacter sp. YIC-310 TaxID=3376632 RepID=UPI003C1E8529